MLYTCTRRKYGHMTSVIVSMAPLMRPFEISLFDVTITQDPTNISFLRKAISRIDITIANVSWLLSPTILSHDAFTSSFVDVVFFMF